MKISKNFSRHESACRCGCGFAAADIVLVRVLERVREAFGPVIVTPRGGWCRCRDYNREVRGAASSKHVDGLAVDAFVRGVDPARIVAWINARYVGTFGVGLYDWGFHLDVREVRARWDRRGE